MPELGDSIFEVMKQDESQPFRTSMGQGLEKNPDEVAKHRKIASQLGTSADFVATDPAGMEQAAKKQGFDYDAFIQKFPKLTAWATNPENASLASDDMDNLSSLESAFHRAKRVESDKVRAENYRRGTGVVTGLATSLVRGVDQLISAPQDVAEATTYATIGRAFGPGAAKKFIDTFSPVSPGYWLGQFGRAGEKALKQTDRQTGGILVSDPKTGQTFMNMQAVNPLTPEGLENISKMFMQEAPAFAAQMAVTGVTGGLGGAALAPKVGKLAGLVAKVGQYAKSPAGMMEVGRTVSGQYNNAVDQFVSQGMDPEQARVKVAPGALLAGVFSAAAGAPMEAKIMEDLLHRVAVLPGGKSIVQKIAGRLWSATTTGAKEGTQEVLNGVGEDLSEWITYNPDKTIQEAAGNAVMNFVGGAAMGGAGGAAAHGANTQEFVQELSNIAKSSKLNQRASDKFQEAVQSMAGEQENLFIPATQYFQTVTDAGLDPAELAQSLGVQNLQEAMEAGTDVVIPVGAYAAQIAATDLHGKLAQDIRLNPGDATMREEEEAATDKESLTVEAQKATEDAQGIQVQAEIDALPVPAVERFQAKRQAQLEAAGFAPDAAAEQARWHAQVFDVLAGSEGLTVEQMDQMFPLEVSGVRAGEGKKSLTDLALDRLKAMGAGIKEYFQDVLGGDQNKGMRLDESTGLPLNQNGTVTVYHHTSKVAADQIRKTGRLKSDAEPDVYVTTRQETDTGYGDTAIPIEVNPKFLQIDDEFPDGRKDFRLSVGKPGGSVRVGIARTFYQSAPAHKLTYSSANGVPLGTHFNRLDPATQDLVTAAIEKDIDAWEANPEAFFAAYDANKETFGGRLVNADIVYSMIPTVQNNLFLGWTAAGGVDLGRLTKIYMLNKELRVRAIDNAGDLPVVVTAGGQASGKTTAAEQMLGGEHVGAVLDAPHDDAKTVEPIVRQILSAGKDAEIVFVDRPNFMASELSNIRRAQREGRYVEPLRRAETAERVPKEMLKLGEIFRNQSRVGLRRMTNLEEGGFSEVGGRLDADGKDAMVSIKNMDIPSSDVLAQQAKEAYLEAGGPNGFPELKADLRSEIERALGISSQPQGSGGLPGGGQAQGGGTVQGVPGSGQVDTFYQRGGGRYASDKEARAARAKRADQNTQASMDKAKMDAHLAEEAEFSVFDSAVKELQAGDILNDKRGFIQVTPDRQFHIGLLEGRDLSTFLHESGHYFLEVMGDLAERPEASERVKGMWADTLKSFGVDVRSDITTEHHEQFAGQMERYLMEGKAPSEKLKPMFQRFKSWLMLVYKQMDKIGVRINDDVRSVFDRLMATDAEIEAHRPQVETFATAKDMGVSQKEFEIYQKAKAGAMEEGRDRLQGEVMKDLLREQKAAYKEEKAQARADVEAGVDSRPDMKAIAALTDPNSSIKLNRSAVAEQFGDARGLPVVEEGGMDAEAAAEMLGFDSGAQLYQALKDAPTRKDLIDTLTDEIMFARYGDVVLDGSIADKAVEALHNDKQADVLAMELRAMKRLQRIAEKVGKAKEGQDKEAQRAADVQIPGVFTERGQARQMISGMTLRQMEPNKYRLAGEKYSKEAYKLKGKKDYQGAANAKQRELLNHFLFLEAKKGQEEAGKIYDYARSLESDTAQGKLGLAGGLDKDGNPKNTFKSQVNALLDRYQFSKETNKALDARQTLLEFVREQEANGEAVMIDPSILNEARRINYREVPMSELRAVRDALKNIQTIAYRQLEMDIDGKHVAKDEAKSEMIASALLNFKAKPLPFSGSDLTLKESASKWIKGKSAMFTKMERVIDWLDGGKIDGPWRSYIFNRIAKAEIAEFDLNTAVTQKFIEAFEKMDPKHRLSMTDSVGVTLPGMDRPLNRRQAITLLMNMGNDQNQEKLLDGYGWTSPQAIGMVGDALGNLTTGDLEFVNTTWKTINALWPAIEALEFKMTGLSPEKVDARPFTVTLKDGSQHMMEGGYFPIVYDPSRSPQGAKQIEGNVNELTDKGFSRPNTPHGFTKSRVQFSAPILLNFEHTLTRHLSQVIKDVTHREAVTDIYSLITSQDIRDALNETIGEAQQKQFLPWLKSVVNDRNGAGTQGLEEFSGGIMAVRSNLITATLAFRLSSVIVQATDLVRAMDRVKPRFMAEAFASFTAAQRLGHNELVDEMREKSGEMRHRPRSFDRDMRVVLQKGFGDQPIKKRVAEFGAHGLSCADAITSTITWVGAYRQALAAGSDEAEAIAEADRTVRLVFQAGSPKDLTPIQKGGALEKLLTMYAGDSFATYGIMQDAGRNYKKGGVKDTPKWAARMLFAVLMPAIIADVIKGRMPEDDEDKAKWIAWKAGLSFFNTLPIIRDVSSSLESGYDYKFTPVAEAIAKAGRAIHSTGKMIEGEKDPVDVAFQGIDAIGTLWGVPGTSQLMQTSKYLYKVSQGEENPDNAAQLVKNAILGKPKK